MQIPCRALKSWPSVAQLFRLHWEISLLRRIGYRQLYTELWMQECYCGILRRAYTAVGSELSDLLLLFSYMSVSVIYSLYTWTHWHSCIACERIKTRISDFVSSYDFANIGPNYIGIPSLQTSHTVRREIARATPRRQIQLYGRI